MATAAGCSADAGADVVKVEPPGRRSVACVVGGRRDRRCRGRRRAVPVPAPRDALGRRQSRRSRGRGTGRGCRRRDRELPAVSVRPERVARRAPRPRRVLDHAVRAHRSVRRATDHGVHRAGRVGRPGRPRLGAQRAVPGGWAYERVAGGHVLGDGGRGGVVARGAFGARRPHRLLDRRGHDDRGEQLRRVRPPRCSAARPSRVRPAPSRRRRWNRRSTATSASAPTAASSSTASCC